MKIQECVHWLELGGGARWVRRAVVTAAALVLTFTVSLKQFHGPQTELTLLQAGVARQLAEGQGFTTLVNYPQTYAVLEARGVPFDEKRAYPELHQPPLYSLTIAAVLWVLPGTMREALFAHRVQPPDGWAPDYLLLGLNLAFFWIEVALVWRLGRRLFDERVAWVAATGTAVSVSLWQRLVAVDGLALPMVLALAVFDRLAAMEDALGETPKPAFGGRQAAIAAALGAFCGLLFLAEYSAGLVAVVVAGWLGWRVRGAARWPAVGVFAAVGALLVTPWLVRNVRWTGHPLGLAGQSLALKAGDATAEPSAQRNLATAEAPVFDFRKVVNKGLTGVERNLQERLWSGGALVLAAFFVAGLAYRFRHSPANRVRWCFVLTLLVLLVGEPFLDSGEGLRLPAYYLAPPMILFGAAFFFVLVDSQPVLGAHWRWAAVTLLALQGLPLFRDALEPRRIHFFFPPYFPPLFTELHQDVEERFMPGTGLATDVPAGAAWYGHLRVWAKPERLRDLYVITVEQNLGALLLTPVTLDRPFFSELATRDKDAIRISDRGGWGAVYAGLVTRRMPVDFPLVRTQKLTDNVVLLLNPAMQRPKGN